MKIALGTVQFGLNYGIANTKGQVSQAEAERIIDRARALSIDTLDTAIAYGDSEQRLGAIGVQDFAVVSKLPAVPKDVTDINKWVSDTVQTSLQRLRLPSMHGVLLHQPSQLLEKNGQQLFQALQTLKDNKKVKKIGVSIYNPSELDDLYKNYHFDLIQAPFNILDQRLIESGWLKRLLAIGSEVHVRSIFLQGLMLFSADSRPAKFNKWSALWKQWSDYLTNTGQSPLEACVRFALSHKEIARVVVGVDSLDQLEEIIRATQGAYQPAPVSLKTTDVELLNPSRWSELRC